MGIDLVYVQAMVLIAHFQMLGRYNRLANERLYERCARLEPADYRKPRQGSFGSIHGLLNHLLLGDRIWMTRFEGNKYDTPPLNTVLFDEFPALRAARMKLDVHIEQFFAHLDGGILSRSFHYRNREGREYVEEAPVAIAHFFNHQTHHRAQVHAMLSQTAVAPPSLDLHRIINP